MLMSSWAVTLWRAAPQAPCRDTHVQVCPAGMSTSSSRHARYLKQEGPLRSLASISLQLKHTQSALLWLQPLCRVGISKWIIRRQAALQLPGGLKVSRAICQVHLHARHLLLPHVRHLPQPHRPLLQVPGTTFSGACTDTMAVCCTRAGRACKAAGNTPCRPPCT